MQSVRLKQRVKKQKKRLLSLLTKGVRDSFRFLTDNGRRHLHLAPFQTVCSTSQFLLLLKQQTFLFLSYLSFHSCIRLTFLDHPHCVEIAALLEVLNPLLPPRQLYRILRAAWIFSISIMHVIKFQFVLFSLLKLIQGNLPKGKRKGGLPAFDGRRRRVCLLRIALIFHVGLLEGGLWGAKWVVGQN
jgi:hypothetical protein